SDAEFSERFRSHIVGHFAHSEPGRVYSRELKTKIKSASQKLMRLAKKRKETYYYVFDMPSEEAARVEAQNHISQLKEDFPAIVFLTLSQDSSLELKEQDCFSPLTDIFSTLKDH
ncbi:MAG: hypothetical protein GY703_01220, partial [Gammaproteobacteria bacterium]|nr:hypothetical protein [Gammaproteobacteria bacterium]